MDEVETAAAAVAVAAAAGAVVNEYPEVFVMLPREWGVWYFDEDSQYFAGDWDVVLVCVYDAYDEIYAVKSKNTLYLDTCQQKRVS